MEESLVSLTVLEGLFHYGWENMAGRQSSGAGKGLSALLSVSRHHKSVLNLPEQCHLLGTRLWGAAQLSTRNWLAARMRTLEAQSLECLPTHFWWRCGTGQLLLKAVPPKVRHNLPIQLQCTLRIQLTAEHTFTQEHAYGCLRHHRTK